MFKSAWSRFALRSFLFGISAADAVLLAALPGISTDDIIKCVLLGISSALGYAGIGAASSKVEPEIGNKA